MAIPSKQIGWSNESNLLWNISKQIEILTGVMANRNTTTTTTTTTVLPIPFILTLDTTGQGDNYNVTLPYHNGFPYTGTINWGDGNTSANEFGANHTYITAGSYTVTVNGIVGSFNTYYDYVGSFLDTLTSIDQFGNQFSFGWAVGGYFAFCVLLTNVASDIPLNSITNMDSMFSNAEAFNGDISGWDVSGVTSMVGVFQSANSFNQPLNSWNVSNVTDMNGMFANTAVFNQDISGWDVSNVTSISEIFNGAVSFSSTNLDAIYNTWSTLTLQPGTSFTDTLPCYSLSAQAGRDILTNAPNNWIITDGGICP